MYVYTYARARMLYHLTILDQLESLEVLDCLEILELLELLENLDNLDNLESRAYFLSGARQNENRLKRSFRLSKRFV